LAPPGTLLDAWLAEFRAAYPATELRHAGNVWRYRRGGTGAEPVLWLTGALGLGEFAFGHIRALGPGFRLVVPDYPPARTLDGVADGLVAILDAEEVDTAHVVGGSFGGMLAQHLVRCHPDRVRSLVLSHTPAPDPSAFRVGFVRVLSLLLPLRLYRALASRRLRGAFVDADPFWLRYFDDAIAGLTKADLTSRAILASEFLQARYQASDLAHWPGQILLLDADDDPLIPAAARIALRRLYPRAQIHSFSGTGHSAAILQPERYVEVIQRFLLAQALEERDLD